MGCESVWECERVLELLGVSMWALYPTVPMAPKLAQNKRLECEVPLIKFFVLSWPAVTTVAMVKYTIHSLPGTMGLYPAFCPGLQWEFIDSDFCMNISSRQAARPDKPVSGERQMCLLTRERERESNGTTFGANFEAANCDEVKVKLDKFPLGKQFVKLLSHFHPDD